MAFGLFILVQERTFADALAIRLEGEPDMDVVVALDTSELPPRVFAGARINVVLLDADFPDDAAFGMSREVSQPPGAARVIFLSSSNDPERIVCGLRAGAAGWVRKDESLARLIDVIRGVARGETWLPPDQIEEISRLLGRGPGHDEDGGDQLLVALTGREREGLLSLTEGARRRDVAEHLRISPKTVWVHLVRHETRISLSRRRRSTCQAV